MTLAANGTWSPLTFVEVRAGLVQLWKNAYGENADTDPNTPDGLVINIFAMGLSQAFDVDTSLWNNSFFRSAVGPSLDRILDLFNKQRNPATSSTATEVFYGVPATAIPSGTVVITADTAANRFATDELAAVGAASNSLTWVVRIMEPVSVGDSYIIQVDANPALATVAGGGDTVTDIATGMRDDVNGQATAIATLAGTDVNGSALLVVEIALGTGNVATTATGSALLDDVEAVRADVTALETGVVVAAAGTLQDLTNPIVGILGVSNDADAVPGVDEENDDEYRARHLQTLFSNAARTDSGIRAAVEAIPDMLEVGVTSNRTEDPVDSFGRPIHSVEVVFLATEGVDVDQQVADAVARQIPAGIEPFGLASMGNGTTIDGEVIEVFATPVEQLYLHIDVTLTPGESFPTAGDVETAVAVAIANYFDTGQLATADGVVTVAGAQLTTGKDMLRTATATAINQATNNGTSNFVMLTAVTATPGGVPVFSAVDQPADPRQIVRADAGRIAVSVL